MARDGLFGLLGARGPGSGSLLLLRGRLELGSLVEVVVVVAVIDGHATVSDVDDLVRHGADEVLVVADEHDRALEVHESALEHVDGVDVEVVRGLV